jgi:hypothetical protein
MWPGVLCSQNAPPRFARIFRVCHHFDTIPIGSLRGHAGFSQSLFAPGGQMHPLDGTSALYSGILYGAGRAGIWYPGTQFPIHPYAHR